VLPGLAEIGAGDLQGRADWDAVQEYIQVVFAWSQSDLGVRMPGGESGEEFFERFDGAVDVIAAGAAGFAEGEVAVAIAHAAAIRTWASLRADNIDASTEAFYQIDNTGVVELDGDPRTGWTVLSWNGNPIGGEQLSDRSAPDPTGEAR
jgi:broad specificity phosphatase PhoE